MRTQGAPPPWNPRFGGNSMVTVVERSGLSGEDGFWHKARHDTGSTFYAGPGIGG